MMMAGCNSLACIAQDGGHEVGQGRLSLSPQETAELMQASTFLRAAVQMLAFSHAA